MEVAALPNDEVERLEALAEYGLTDTSVDPALQGIVELAARLCDAPVALISMVQSDRQHFIARVGLKHLSDTGRDISICAHAILGEELMEVPDTHLDHRFHDNPLVRSDLQIRFYAGKPLITPDGFRLGTLCVIDRRPRTLSDGQRDGLHSLAALVTSLLEKRLTERRLRVSEARYKLAITGASVGILDRDLASGTFFVSSRLLDLLGYRAAILQDADGRVIAANDAAEEALGLDQGELIGRRLSTAFPQATDEQGEIVEARELDRMAAQRFANPVRRRIINFQHPRHGERRWLMADAVPIPATRTSDRMAYILISDITARKQAESARRASEAHLARAQRIAGIGSAELYFDADRWVWSDELYRICGLDRAAVSPSRKLLLTILHEADREPVQRGLEAARGGVAPEPIEYRIIRPDGSMRTLHREAELIRDDRGTVVGMISTHHDVTDMREAERQKAELERQVLRLQRVEALGTLAGGIAHDLNNLLLPIFTMSGELLRSAPEGSREREYIALIQQAGKRARDLVRRLLTFARCDQPTVQPLDLAAFVADALPLLRASLPRTVALRQKIEAVPSVLAEEGQLHQVLLNLVTNSAQAIGVDGGEITIEVVPTTNGAGDGHTAGVRLTVVDDGCGMDGETQRRAFEPFFTTKSVENGTGLGLSVVQSIIANHGGSIDLKSAPGHGTRIDLHFPAA
jgi:PAS domain S-box-containing protein